VNVLFFMQHLGVGGVVRQTARQVDGLNRRGHRASLVALQSVDEGWRPLWDPGLPPVEVLVPRVPRSTVATLVALVRAAVRLRRRLREEDVDVLYAHQGPAARLVGWLATRGLRRTALAWGVQGSGSRRALTRAEWRHVVPHRLGALVSGSVDLLVANSEPGLENYRRSGWRCRRLVVVPNGVDLEEFRPDPEAGKAVRAEWGLDGVPLVGHVARLDPAKDHPTFLQAAALLAARRDDVRFALVGAGPDDMQARLGRLAEELGLGGRLVWAGLRNDMRAVYNALDVLCSSSIREGSSLVIAEAMACGTPCVVTRAGDAARFVGAAGVLVPVGAPEALADGLERVLATADAFPPEALRARVERLAGLEAALDALEAALVRGAGARPRGAAGSFPRP
jgi:glycosyltransferase involved in cell wall biosynthesis